MRHAFSLSAAACLALILATAATAPAQAADRTLIVSGEGTANGAPDEARLSAGVVTTGRTAATALGANANAMSQVFDTLKKAGIADKDIGTSGFSVEPQYATNINNAPPRITGYQATNNVTVRVDDLARVGATIDALVASGANNLGDVSFSRKNPKPLIAQARADAVADALARAQALANAAGVTLGPITTIADGYSRAQDIRQVPISVSAFANADKATPISAGEQTFTASVTITWEIR